MLWRSCSNRLRVINIPKEYVKVSELLFELGESKLKVGAQYIVPAEKVFIVLWARQCRAPTSSHKSPSEIC